MVLNTLSPIDRDPIGVLQLDPVDSPGADGNSIDYNSLLFHVNHITGAGRLCIPPAVAKNDGIGTRTRASGLC